METGPFNHRLKYFGTVRIQAVRVPKNVKSYIIYTSLFLKILVSILDLSYRSAHVELFIQNGGLIGLHFLLMLRLRQQKFFRSQTENFHGDR